METTNEAVVVTPLATAEDGIKRVERACVKAFRAYVQTPSLTNRTALIATLEDASKDAALDVYRKEFVKANFS